MKQIILIVVLLSAGALSGQVSSTKELFALHKEYKKKAASDTASVNALLKIGNWHLIARLQADFPKSTDSVLYYAEKALSKAQNSKYSVGQGQANMLYSRFFYYTYKEEESRVYAKKALDLFTGQKYYRGMAEANLSIAVSYEDLKQDAALEAALKAKEIYRKMGDKVNEGYVAGQLAAFYTSRGEPKNALLYTKICMELYDEAGYKADDYIMNEKYLAELLFKEGNIEESFKYSIKALREAELLDPNSGLTGDCCLQLAKLYFFSKQYKEAEPYYRRAYIIYNNFTDQYMHVLTASSLAQVLTELHRYKEALSYLRPWDTKKDLDFNSRATIITRYITIYTYLKDFHIGRKYIGEAVTIINNSPDNQLVFRVMYPAVGKYYYASGEYELARKYYEKYRKWAEKTHNKPALEDVYLQVFKIDSVQNNFESAVMNLKMAQQYKDSMLNEGSNRRIDELKVQYDLFKKERDLKLEQKNNKLLVQRNELQHEKLARSNLARNVSIAGTLIVIIFLGLLYSRHKANKKTNALLQQQQEQILSSNKTLQHMVAEKEWLLKEIHHRVKNNLHMIMSLLNSQSYFLEDKAALSAIQNSQHRIQSMSLIHQKLYMTDNLSAIRMQDYINDLIEYLTDSFSLTKAMKFHTRIEDVEMDVSQAVPIGLILNEAITNSIKYGFPQGSGIISVSLVNTIGDTFSLEIADNGIGLPEGFDIANAKSLGMRLIKGLAEDMDGVLSILGSAEGTYIKIEFLYKQLLFEMN